MDKYPQFWKIIDELKKNAVPTDKSESKNRTEWFNHFNNLLRTNNVNPIDSNRKEQVISELRNYESLNTINGSLDFAITEQEVQY